MKRVPHPVLALFPEVAGVPFDDLVADIRAHGLLAPIVIRGDVLLDGRGRLKACALAEFCDAVRELPLDEATKADARHSAKQIAASVIGALLPEIADELAARLADRRISEAA